VSTISEIANLELLVAASYLLADFVMTMQATTQWIGTFFT